MVGTLLIRLIGIIWIVFGILGLAATKRTMQTIYNWIKSTRRQTLGLSSLIVGVLLVLSASSTAEAWFVLVMGIIACLKGIAIILLSDQKVKAVIDWWQSAPDIIHKDWASMALIFGIMMFYIA